MHATTSGLSLERLQRVSRLTERYVAEGKLPGTLTLVARRGHVAHLEANGHVDVEAGTPVARDTIFRIFSMSKPITSVALMTLYEEGHFQLDDPVSQFIPGFKDLTVFEGGTADSYTTRPVDREMTIRDLLTHTSGLTYGFMNTNVVDELYRERGVEGSATIEEMAQKLCDVPLQFSPGTKWRYSVATDVCGYLVQAISGIRFDEYLRTRIFEPLGMVDTGFHVPADKAHRLAANYQRTPDDGLKLVDPPATSRYLTEPTYHSGGGGLVSTIDDYYRFAAMLLGKGQLDGVQILGRKTVELILMNHLPTGGDLTSMGQAVFSETPYDGIGFGLGFSVMLDPSNAKILGTPGEGAWGGAASTYFWVDPGEELIVILMTQLLPSSSYPIRREMRVAAYQAIVD